MIDITKLNIVSPIKALEDIVSHGIKKGDILIVKQKGFSGWDNCHYIECKTPLGYTFEIYNGRNLDNIKKFSL